MTTPPNFPFAVPPDATPEQREGVNRTIGETIASVENMIYQRVRRRGRGQLDDGGIEDMVQECRIHLWQKSLPKFDASRGVKVSTYLHQCADNFINGRMRTRPKPRPLPLPTAGEGSTELTIFARDESADRRIEVVAADVLAHPEKYLTDAQVVVFKALINSPGIPMKDLAKRLGYRRASALSIMKRRIFERITGISIEDGGLALPADPADQAARVRRQGKARRLEALELRRAGLTFSQIAHKLGYSKTGARNAVAAAEKAARAA